MSKLEKLNNRYSQLKDLLDTIDAATRKIDADTRAKQQEVLERYFTAEEGDTVECSYTTVSIRRADSDKYASFLDIYVDYEWNDTGREFTNLYISNSSFRTNEISEWTADRFASQAHYTRLAVDFQDDILAELNQIAQEARELIKDVNTPARELRKESSEVSKEIQAIEKEARQKALMSEEGLTIEGKQVESYWKKGEFNTVYPDLQVKFDWTLRSIRGLRIDRLSASGKSADITVKVKRDRWTEDGSVLREQIIEEKVERVRMENIDSFLRSNNITI